MINEPESEFPIGFYEEFLQEIIRRGIKTVTYADLFASCSDFDHLHGFPQEFRQWETVRDPQSTYLVIQHDVDNYPDHTKRMVQLEASYGIHSSIFIFVERATSHGVDCSYQIDHDYFQEMESLGYVIGYHQNALSLTTNLHDAKERFISDVHTLRKRYKIEFVVPHGGRSVTISGTQHFNHDIDIPDELNQSLRWVYNKYGVKFATRWSDGGLRKSRDPDRLANADLVGSFLASLKPGTRNFCLVHPQRWGLNVNDQLNPLLARQGWYQRVLARHKTK